MSEGPTTSAIGFSSKFAQLETTFNDLRGQVLEAVGDGKLELSEVVSLRDKLATVAMELDYFRVRLANVEDNIRMRSEA